MSQSSASISPSQNHSVAFFAVGFSQEADAVLRQVAYEIQTGYRSYPSVSLFVESLEMTRNGWILLALGSSIADEALNVSRLRMLDRFCPIVGVAAHSSLEAGDFQQIGLNSIYAFSELANREQLREELSSLLASANRQRQLEQNSLDARERLEHATAKEAEVLDLIIQGRKNREIAELLGITVRAVEDRRFRLMRKLKVESVAELITVAIQAQYAQ